MGEVTDASGQPIAQVTITGGGQTVQSDNEGRFRIAQGSFNGLNAAIRFERTGYFTLVKTMVLEAGRTGILRVRLLPETSAGIVTNAGGSVSLGNGALTISFPDNAFVTANGSAYTGNVQVQACYLAAGSPALPYVMPGNLSGLDTQGIRRLQTFGMTGVVLRDPAGAPLQLAPGKKAVLSVAIAANQTFQPATMPLWHFDEQRAIWVREGTANKVGNRYTGEVSHFSFWNFDYAWQQVFLKFRAHNRADSMPVPNLLVELTTNTGASAWSATDTGGLVSGWVFQSAPMRLRVYHYGICGAAPMVDTVIGPYAQDVDLGRLYFNFTASAQIRGTLLNCTGRPVSRGSVTVPFNGMNYNAPLRADGSFSVSLFGCANVSTVLISGIDSSTGQTLSARPLTLNANQVTQTGPLFACQTAVPQFISYYLDGTEFHFTRGVDSAYCRPTFALNRTEIGTTRPGGPVGLGITCFVRGPVSTAWNDTSTLLYVNWFSASNTPRSLNQVSFTESYSAYPPSRSVPGWVTGENNCRFTDQNGTVHTLRTFIHMWRPSN